MKRTLFAVSEFSLREGCGAIVVELTDRAVTRMSLRRGGKGGGLEPPASWKATPIIVGKQHDFYSGAFGGCNNNGDTPLGDLPGWLERPGALYKIVNGGEGIAIIVPRSKLAGFYYFG